MVGMLALTSNGRRRKGVGCDEEAGFDLESKWFSKAINHV